MSAIPTEQTTYTVGLVLTGFNVSVADCNLDGDLTIKDFVVIDTDTDLAIPNSFWTKLSRTVIRYNGPNLVTGDILTINRSTELERVQQTIQLGSTISSSILDAEILRIYKLLAEKVLGIAVENPVNNVTRSAFEPNVRPVALGDEWHQVVGGSGPTVETVRVWVATDVAGLIDELGWFEVTGVDGEPGLDGIAGTVSVGTVTTGVPGSNVVITNVGTPNAAVLNFTIPRGDQGLSVPGIQGPAGTISIGTVTTGPEGTSASVANVGTANAAVLNFTIPRGNDGEAGVVTAASSVILTQITTPAAPAAGNTAVYSKTVGGIFFRPAGGVETQVRIVEDPKIDWKFQLMYG